MLKIVGKTAYYTFLGFLGVLVLAILSTLFPIPGNFQMLVVQSGSMEPNIQTGSVVVIRPAADYDVGDVVTFGPVSRTKAPITHRVASIEGQGSGAVYTTKGDANENQDPNTTARKDVLGKVLFSIPYFGFVLDFARQPLGFALIIGVPAAIIIGDELRKIFVEAKRLVKEKKQKNVPTS
ncbi:MAG TPA: signal peptidase I [Candidatus Paceibacterota bacterium]